MKQLNIQPKYRRVTNEPNDVTIDDTPGRFNSFLSGIIRGERMEWILFGIGFICGMGAKSTFRLYKAMFTGDV